MSERDRHDRLHQGQLYVSATVTAQRRRDFRRKLTVAGVTGAVAVLAGAYLLTTRVTETGQEAVPEPAALAPLTTAATPAIDETGRSAVPGNLRASRATRPAQPAKRAPSPTPATLAALSAPVGGPSGPEQRGIVTRRVETVQNGTVRVSSARFDLTGQNDLPFAADAGYAAGNDVRCTTRVRFSADEPVAAQPNLLLCWRVSDRRSVVTMAVAAHGLPDPRDSVDIIAREWASLE
ncbi:hypothetical protein [Actinoplanes regularis]|uniref:Uncharacterized protein n=1 Tax=Actinoplanes regularis TaxID=52697 RepID=A0A239DC53_9ACTN|nr:hypothetical protein [Actinoplanes regularis]GIE88758.1 hypothetical protein Are01nite_52380 [Actinoplanes regularis]SNS29900.1 hypothetical protein SAMN06264365_11392 [Actinoplanes regularis]